MSLKKTDKEDALKLARLVMRFPREELPEASLPSEEEECYRALMSEQGYLQKERTRLVNRLHSVYLRAGLTTVTKKELSNRKSRSVTLEKLNGYEKVEAQRAGVILDLREGCTAIRRVAVQAAWSLVHSNQMMYVLVKKKEYYTWMDKAAMECKLKWYGICPC